MIRTDITEFLQNLQIMQLQYKTQWAFGNIKQNKNCLFAITLHVIKKAVL